MTLIKALSGRIEREQTQKLRELSSSTATASVRAAKGAGRTGTPLSASADGEEVDFESLVTGRGTSNGTPDIINDWDGPAARPVASRSASQQQTRATLDPSWTATTNPTPRSMAQSVSMNALRAQPASNRSITPDQSLGAFAALKPNSAFSNPLQPTPSGSLGFSQTVPTRPVSQNAAPMAVDWSAASTPSINPWSTTAPASQNPMSSFNIAPPPRMTPVQNTTASGMNSAFRPPNYGQSSQGSFNANVPPQQPPPKQGLDKFESLL